MRAAPALQFTLERFGVWRAAVALLCAASAATGAAWLGAGAWSAAAAMAAGVCAMGSTRRAPQRLSWDGEVWRVGPAALHGDELAPGTLRAMIDFGDFLLLRFEAGDTRAVQWLPVQRRGLEASWHPLRCAIYSPRPAAAASAAADDPPPPSA